MSGQPTQWPLLYWGFERYVQRFVRRHFNALRVCTENLAELPQDAPLLVCANHPGWWDPMMGVLLRKHLLARHRLYAPMDARALANYPTLQKLGFYGISHDSLEGAKQFLTTTRRLMQDPKSSVWVTPQGRFTDVRESTELEPGLGHLLSKLNEGWVVPLAMEYPFWHERDPEALMRFGRPLEIAKTRLNKEQWQQQLGDALASTQQELAQLSIRRDESAFRILVQGRAGVGATYDVLRRAKAWWHRTSFEAGHQVFSERRKAS